MVQTKQLLSFFTSVKNNFAIIKPNSKYVSRKRLLVSGYIHANPGPKGTTKTKEITVKDKSIYPCAYCESGVTWGQAGVCCDNCEVWFYKTCLSLNTSSFENLQDSNVSWICNRCNFTNSESSLFQSYNLELHNSLPSLNSSIASVDSVFTPEKNSVHLIIYHIQEINQPIVVLVLRRKVNFCPRLLLKRKKLENPSSKHKRQCNQPVIIFSLM